MVMRTLSQKAVATLPHKALPNDLGKVHYFYHKDEFERKVLLSHLEFAAHDLMHTSIAVQEAAYPTAPSVLIMTTSSVSHGLLHKELGVAQQREVGLYQNTSSAGQDLSLGSFLERISVDKATGVHYSFIANPDDEPTVAQQIRHACRYFDIIFVISHRQPPVELVDHAFGPSFCKNAGKKHTRLLVPDSIVDSYILHQSKAYGLFPSASAKADPAVVRAYSMDIVREMLGVKGKKTVYEQIPQMNWVSRLATQASDKLVGTKPGIASLIGSVTLFTTGGVMAALGMDTGMGFDPDALPFLVTGAPTISILLSRTFDYVATFSHRKKKISKYVSQRIDFYDRCDVIESKAAAVWSKLPGIAELEGKRLVEQARSDDTAITHDSPMTYGVVPLEDLRARVSRLKEEWMSYELDPMKALDYPLMLDATCEHTAGFLQAMREVELCLESVKKDASQTGRLSRLVEQAEIKFLAAEAHAKKMRLVHLDENQRKTVGKVRTLASVMIDASASPNEKRAAFEQGNKLLEGILPPLSSKVIGLLEA